MNELLQTHTIIFEFYFTLFTSWFLLDFSTKRLYVVEIFLRGIWHNINKSFDAIIFLLICRWLVNRNPEYITVLPISKGTTKASSSVISNSNPALLIFTINSCFFQLWRYTNNHVRWVTLSVFESSFGI